jgi:hypothetical protein
MTKKYFFGGCILDGSEYPIFVEIAGIQQKSIFLFLFFVFFVL